MAHSLDSLLKPKTVAVIGASRTRGTIGAEIFHNLIANGFTGAVYPINPGRARCRECAHIRICARCPTRSSWR